MWWEDGPVAAPSLVDPRFLLPDEAFQPAYVALYESGELARRVDEARRALAQCRTCPRACGVNRLADQVGVCRIGRYARVASAFPHFGEEDCLRGWRGSGTLFFSGCNLRCVFCQNWDISQQPVGRPLRPRELAARMLELQEQGVHNINWVTPEHVVPQLLEALLLAVEQGLRLPIVYNTSAYDALESLRWLDGVVDIYMPDFKVWQPEHARRYLKAPDYPEVVRRAILEMHRQVGPLKFNRQGLARRGVLVRHLVLPGLLDDTAAILRWLAQAVSPDTYVNLMAQYRPEYQVVTTDKYPELRRRVRGDEYRQAVALAREAGLWRLDVRWL